MSGTKIFYFYTSLIAVLIIIGFIATFIGIRNKNKAQEIIDNKCFVCHEGHYKLDSVSAGQYRNIYNYKCDNCGELFWTQFELK